MLGRGNPKRATYLRVTSLLTAGQFMAALTGTATLSATIGNTMAASMTGTATMTAALLTDKVAVKASANISADPGDATTAVLPAPSGKTTAAFTPGRILDDTRLTPSINIGQEGYTELEWSITTTSLIAGGDVLEFRVVLYPSDTLLDQYTATPTWIIGSSDTTLAASMAGTASLSANLSAPAPLRPKGVINPTVAETLRRAVAVRIARPNPLQFISGQPEDDVGLRMAAALTGTATVTAPLSTSITMASGMAGTATLDAQLTTSLTLAAALTGTATIDAPLQIGGEIAAVLDGTATVAAALDTAITMAAVLDGVATITPNLQTNLAATLAGTATLTADLTTGGSTMAAALLATAGLTASLTTGGSTLACALVGTATVLADLTAPVAVPDHPVTVTGMARAAIAWRDNVGTRWLALGTHSNLQVFAGGVLTDITPTTFTVGRPNTQTTTGAYGQGAYGIGAYGVGDTAASVLDEASVWSLDTFGQYLVGVMPEDGQIVVWEASVANPAYPLNTAGFPGTTDGGHPTSALGVVVTPERYLMALGVNGDPRLVQWADQESLTVWNPSAINSAGDFPLQTPGSLRAGRAGKNETLIWTDTDLWKAVYIGAPLIYAFERVGTACGVISRGSMAVVDGQAFWMGLTGFYRYDGWVRPMPCDVVDLVFNDFNRTQAAKVTCHTIAEYNEVWWHYPSAGSLENDRYVAVNIQDGTWMAGVLGRTCGVDRGTLGYPVLVGADGICYEHEKGNDRGGLLPYAETGYLELADGDVVSLIRRLIPDDRNLGDVDVVISVRDWPNGAVRTYGPYDLSAPTNLRITGREIALRVQEREASDWRVGDLRIDLVPRGKR